MTDDTMALHDLLEESSDAELLREMIGLAAERLMALEVVGLIGAGAPPSLATGDDLDPLRRHGASHSSCHRHSSAMTFLATLTAPKQ